MSSSSLPPLLTQFLVTELARRHRRKSSMGRRNGKSKKYWTVGCSEGNSNTRSNGQDMGTKIIHGKPLTTSLTPPTLSPTFTNITQVRQGELDRSPPKE